MAPVGNLREPINKGQMTQSIGISVVQCYVLDMGPSYCQYLISVCL